LNFLPIKYIFFALRPKQWIKNLFIFLPLVFGRQLFVFSANLKALSAFFIFSMASAAVYLVNDIADAEKDKLHPRKSLRPIVSGRISIRKAQIIALMLGILSVLLSSKINLYFGIIVIVYIVLNYVYTKVLKNIIIIDVFLIGVFFILRIMVGSVVTGIKLSSWIIIMTMLFALFLGFTKRYQELKLFNGRVHSSRHIFNKYNVYLLNWSIAITSLLTIITYTLYMVDFNSANGLGIQRLIWSIPFVYYGLFHHLYLIYKVGVDGDPTEVLFSDRKTQLNLICWIITCIIVIYSGV